MIRTGQEEKWACVPRGVPSFRWPTRIIKCNFLKLEIKHARRKTAQEPSPGPAIVYIQKIA